MDGSEKKIRYLTNRECFRLMGFDDPEIDKMIAAVPSKAQLYKLAGNSIVVDCLEQIFRGMFIDETFTGSRPKQTQLLFFEGERK